MLGRWLFIAILALDFGLARGMPGSRPDRGIEYDAKLFRDWGLPLPPKSARLAYWLVPRYDYRRSDSQKTVDLLVGFLVPGPRRLPRVWLGMGYLAGGTSGISPNSRQDDLTYAMHNAHNGAPPAPLVTSTPTFGYPCRGGSPYWIDTNFATAIQLWLRGDKPLARELYANAAPTVGFEFNNILDLGPPSDRLLGSRLGYAAVAFFLDGLRDEDRNLPRIQTGLRRAVASGSIAATPALTEIIRALTPKAKVADSTTHDVRGALARSRTSMAQGPFVLNADAMYREVARRGFGAVPGLIQLCSDNLPTRGTAYWTGVRPVTVGDLAQSILGGLSGLRTWDREHAGKVFEQWFRKAKAIGEQRYLLCLLSSSSEGPRSRLKRLAVEAGRSANLFLTRAMTQHKNSHGNGVQAYGYDAASQRIKLVDPDGGVRTLTYDSDARLTSQQRPSGTFTMAYDAAARLTKRTAPSSGVTGFGYDANDQITSITETGPTGTLFQYTTYLYDGAGNRTGINDSNGSLTTYVNDAKYRLTADNTSGTNAHNYAYSYTERTTF